MTSDYSVVRAVTVAAAIARTLNPHKPPVRHCKVCGEPAAAGSYWCRECRSGR